MGAPAAAGGLLVGQVDHAVRRAFVCLTHGQYIGGVDGREVANLAGKRRPSQSLVDCGQIVSVFLGGIKQ